MKDETKYTFLYEPGSKLYNELSALLFYGFLGWLVWLSHGSVWWTFFFGCIAIVGLATRMKSKLDAGMKKFNTKAELLAFVQTLPE